MQGGNDDERFDSQNGISFRIAMFIKEHGFLDVILEDYSDNNQTSYL